MMYLLLVGKYKFYKGNKKNGGLAREMTLQQYIQWKRKLLERDFYLILTESEIREINECQTELQVDRKARKFILAKLK